MITLLESHTPQEVAKILGISPRWVYTLRKRYQEGGCNLKACIRKRGPRNPMPNRTPLHLEHIVRELWTSEVAPHPQEEPGIAISPGTIRNILHCYQVRCKRYRVNLEAFAPLEFWQIDAKDIADQKALPSSAYAAIFRNKLPRYQFTAIDVRTRVRFLTYAKELSFLNGLTFMLLLVFLLRAFGVQHQLFFQTDNGSEFGGVALSRKRTLMERFVFEPLGVSPPSTSLPTRSSAIPLLSDEEFYIPNLENVTSRKAFFRMAQEWLLSSTTGGLTSGGG